MTDCKHEEFDAHVHTGRITEVEGGPVKHFVTTLIVRCAQCGRPFRFKGLPDAFSVDFPTIDPTGCEVRLPMEPLDPDTSVC